MPKLNTDAWSGWREIVTAAGLTPAQIEHEANALALAARLVILWETPEGKRSPAAQDERTALGGALQRIAANRPSPAHAPDFLSVARELVYAEGTRLETLAGIATEVHDPYDRAVNNAPDAQLARLRREIS